MNTRPLGQSGLQVAPLALGGNVFGWTIDEPTSFAILDAFTAAGFNLIDTADVYSRWKPGNAGGESESIIGNWLASRGNRGQVLVATKVGMDMGADQKGLSRDHIFKSAEASLRRLRTDYIDLYQAHTDDEHTPLEETLGAFAELIQQGKVRAIGASNYTADRLARALRTSEDLGLPAYQSLQPHYNLIERSRYEDHLAPLCLQAKIGVIPYYALAAGFLTGKYRTEADLAKSPRGEGAKKYLTPRGHEVLAALDAVAARHGTTPGQVALAWLLTRPTITAPIASATSLAQLEDLIAATRLELDLDSIANLDAASA